ncbi:unnamed protein product [Leuciscus chuanchicus]
MAVGVWGVSVLRWGDDDRDVETEATIAQISGIQCVLSDGGHTSIRAASQITTPHKPQDPEVKDERSGSSFPDPQEPHTNLRCLTVFRGRLWDILHTQCLIT